VLIDAAGQPVMAGRHPLGDLAPRDVVAAAMRERMDATGAAHLWLDATSLGGRLETGFPTVTAMCRAAGIDPVSEPIPVAPGAHYCCGGIAAGLDGRTSVPGLLAVGEAASTGVHGANRLASNSLTEAMITGRRAGDRLGRELPGPAGPLRLPPAGPGVSAAERSGLAAQMWRCAGVLRDRDELERLAVRLTGVPPGPDATLAVAEATSLHAAATLVVAAALGRAESRGCHRWRDRPATSDGQGRHSVLRVRDGQVVASEAGLADAGLADAGLADAELADAGLADTGLADAGGRR